MITTEFTQVPGHNQEVDDILLAKRAADQLHKHYPNYPWAVHVNSEGGVMNIFNLAVSSVYGYVLHLRNVYGDPDLKRVMRAGGEILERAHLFRGEYKGEDVKTVEGAKKRLHA